MNELVVVEWMDASKTMNDDSFNQYVDIDGLVRCMSTVGWLYGDTENTVLLVQELDNGIPRDWVVIPRSFIKSIKKVTVND